MTPERFVVIDLETTGLDAKLDKIIEIGAVKFEGGVETETYSSYINPGVRLPENIVELTGITEEDLKDAPDMSEVIDKLEVFLGDSVLVGHNLMFDYSFLKRAFSYYRKTFEKQGIDTLKVARACLPELPHKTLGDLCIYYEIPIQAHRALGDARATGILYRKLWETFGEKEETKKCFLPGQLVYKVKKDSPASEAQKQLLQKLIKQHDLTPDYEIEKLTKSEASRHIDRILNKRV